MRVFTYLGGLLLGALIICTWGAAAYAAWPLGLTLAFFITLGVALAVYLILVMGDDTWL